MTPKTAAKKATTSAGPLDPTFVTTLTEPLSPKDQKVLGGLAEGKSVAKAAESAGVSTGKAKQLLHRADVQALFRQAMERQGLSLDSLATTLAEGLKAEEAKIVKGEGVKMVKDYAVRHKYLETALKLIKALSPDDKKGDDVADRTTIHINLGGDPPPKVVAGKVIETKKLSDD